jgi:hypothetical protein
MLPGDGELPLADIVAAMPLELPVAVEAPNLQLCGRLGPLEFLRRARRSAARLLDGPHDPHDPPDPNDASRWRDR